MAEEELQVITLRDDFYRDSFGKVILFICSIFLAIALLAGLSLYLHLNKPKPVTFPVGPSWRVKPPVPVNEPYLSRPDVLQWVSDVIPKAFVFDFNHYNDQLKTASQYFTSDGWKVFLNQLNNFANYNNVQAYKLFVTAEPTAAPTMLNEGLLLGRYAWWVELPIQINYSGYSPPPSKSLTLQVLVVRVSTLNNLTGIGIHNVIVAKGALNQ